MDHQFDIKRMTRRELLRNTTVLASAVALAPFFPRSVFAQAQRGAAATPANHIDQMRAQLAMSPIETVKLGDNLTMLGGPGGNVVVLYGPDGKIVVDSFVQPVWPKLKQTIDGMGNAPV